MGDWPNPTDYPIGPKAAITTAGIETQYAGIVWNFAGSGLLTTAWPAANLGIILPMMLPEPFLVAVIAGENGATLGSNIDVTWWNRDLTTKLVTTGSVAQAGASAMQTVNVTDTTIPAGESFITFVASGTAGLFRTLALSTARNPQMAGIRQFSGAVPVGASVTPAQASTATVLPIVTFSSMSVL
jgi:hypothetical protein